MSKSDRPLGRVTEAVSAKKLTEAAPTEKIQGMDTLSPRKAAQSAVTSVLKFRAVRRILHSLALTRLLKFLLMVCRAVGLRVLPVVAVIIGGWLLRRARRR
jgi:hypothetical protein